MKQRLQARRDIAITVALLAVVIPTLTWAYRHPVPTTIAMSLAAAAAFAFWNGYADAVRGFTSILIGPAVELAATTSGLWTYAFPSVLGLPLWVFPLWWIYATTIARLIEAVTARSIPTRGIAWPFVLLVLEVPLLCGFGVTRPTLALAGTLVLLIAFLYRYHTRVDAAALFFCGVIGPAAELLPVGAGAWTYPAGPLLGLPLWLPTGYSVFGAALIYLGTELSVLRRSMVTKNTA